MIQYKNKIYFIVIVLLMLCTIAGSASARVLNTSAAKDFADAKPVTSKEMGITRGGYINANGLLLSFGYTAVASINGVVQNSVSFTDTTLTQAIAAGKNLQTIIAPTILQNANNNVQIALNQTLNLVISGATMHTTIGAATAFASSRAFH